MVDMSEKILALKSWLEPSVVHAYNPSYSGGRGRRINLRPAWAKVKTPKNELKAKRLGAWLK
jgi:hypothetical protein